MSWIVFLLLCRFEPGVFGFPNGGEVIDNEYIEEAAGLFEGDIELDTDRNAVLSHHYVWPNGIVYYTISSQYSSSQRNSILSAMREIEGDTAHSGKKCVQFVERTNQHNYIHIYSESGCHSPVGMHSGQKTVSLTSGCFNHGTIMHEFLHTLGFYHEHTRYDREKYVTIFYDNIPHEKWHNFNEHSTHDMTLLGLPYDYTSIMHYKPYEFATDKSKPSIAPKQAGVEIGQRLQLSFQDVREIQTLYSCTVDTGHVVNPEGQLHFYIDCNFENDLCGMEQTTHDDFQYVRQNIAAPAHEQGPTADHSSGAGYYLYAVARHHSHDAAAIMTPAINEHGYFCFTFAYYNGGGATFAVKITGTHSSKSHTVARYHSSHERWYTTHHTLHVSSSMGAWRLSFESDISSEHGGFGFDDLKVYEGHCSV